MRADEVFSSGVDDDIDEYNKKVRNALQNEISFRNKSDCRSLDKRI